MHRERELAPVIHCPSDSWAHSTGHTKVMQSAAAPPQTSNIDKNKLYCCCINLSGPGSSLCWLSLQVSHNPTDQFVTESRAAALGYLEGLDQLLEDRVALSTVLVLLRERERERVATCECGCLRDSVHVLGSFPSWKRSGWGGQQSNRVLGLPLFTSSSGAGSSDIPLTNTTLIMFLKSSNNAIQY